MKNPTTLSNALGIPLGRFIDVESFDGICKLGWERLPNRGHRELFGMGWNGVGKGARAAELHADAYDRLFSNEPAASAEERFRQDDELFGFVTNAMAASEALVFSSFILARAYDNKPLKEADLKTLLGGMLEDINAVPQTEVLGGFLGSARADDHGRSLIEFRDVLLHRGRPSRHHWVGGRHHGRITVASNPKGIPSSWQPDTYLESGGLGSWGDWLDQYVAWSMPLIWDALAGIP